MPTRRRGTTIDDLGIFEGGLTPAQMIMQSELAQTPSAFSYADLDKKYPTRQVTPMVPTYIQQQLDQDLLERKEQLATQRYREAQASIYESQLNEKIQAAEQIPLARQAFSQLNPQDPKYPQMRDEILMNYPYVEGDTAFMKSIVGRNDRVYENYFKKNLAIKNLTKLKNIINIRTNISKMYGFKNTVDKYDFVCEDGEIKLLPLTIEIANKILDRVQQGSLTYNSCFIFHEKEDAVSSMSWTRSDEEHKYTSTGIKFWRHQEQMTEFTRPIDGSPRRTVISTHISPEGLVI
jgi:hypothetical protein